MTHALTAFLNDGWALGGVAVILLGCGVLLVLLMARAMTKADWYGGQRRHRHVH